MTSRIKSAIEDARNFFEIEDFPGDLFAYITRDSNYIDKYRIIIFKEDLDKLHGFVAYENEYAYIGINHKRPIGLQNLTLAHEIGHVFLHRGKAFSNRNEIERRCDTDTEEKEAFEFGRELLYPTENMAIDYEEIVEKGLLQEGRERDLGLFINTLCHKYYLSFPVVLRAMLYKAYMVTSYNKVLSNINGALGDKYTQLDSNFYIADGSSYDKSSNFPYVYLKIVVEKAVKQGKLSVATGESILYPYLDRGED